MSFSSDITNFVKKTGIKADTVIRKLALDGFRGVVMKSPVDTGRFRGSWRIGVGTTDLSTLPEQSRASVALPATDAVSRESAKLSSVKFGTSVIISNNVEYAYDLERGTSKQAPAGVLLVTFEELRAGFSRIVQSVK